MALLFACAGCTKKEPSGPGRIVALDTDVRGLSGLTVDDHGAFWASGEDGDAVVRIDPETFGVTRYAVAEGLAGTDLEAMAWVDGTRFVLGTETQEKGRLRDVILDGRLEGERFAVASVGHLDYARWHLAAPDNRGIEGICHVDGVLVLATELVELQRGRRWAPLGMFDPKTQTWAAHRVGLTSKTGKLAAIDCRIVDGAVEALAVERHYGVSRLLRFSHSARPRGSVDRAERGDGPIGADLATAQLRRARMDEGRVCRRRHRQQAPSHAPRAKPPLLHSGERDSMKQAVLASMLALGVAGTARAAPFELSDAVTEHVREIHARNAELLDDAFSKMGGSSVASKAFLYCFATPHVELNDHQELAGTVDYFNTGRRNSFNRQSQAAGVSWNLRYVLGGRPANFRQELAATQARWALILFGGNDAQNENERIYLRRLVYLVEQLEEMGVVPILGSALPRRNTYKDRWIRRFNAITEAVAEHWSLPYIDYHGAMTALPTQRLSPRWRAPKCIGAGRRSKPHVS